MKFGVLVVILQRQYRLMMYLVVNDLVQHHLVDYDLNYVLLKCFLEMVDLSVVDYLIAVHPLVDLVKFAHFRLHLVNPDVNVQ